MREYVQRDLSSPEERTASLEDILEAGHRRVCGRRDVLKMGGAAGLAYLLAACTSSNPKASPSPIGSSTPTEHDARVVVVGAGLAGTTAAYRLAQQGVHVQLFEARDRVGGRCWTARGFADGQTAEHGGEFIDSRHVHLRGLAKELGLPLDDLWKGWVQGSIWPDWIGGHVLDHGAVEVHMDRISKAVTAEAHRIGVFDSGKPNSAAYSYGTATDAAAEVDQLTMQDWLDRHVAGIPADITQFLNESMAAWYGLDMPQLSALNWIDYFVIPWPGGDERWHVRGGNDQVPTAAADKLPSGTLHLSAALESMSMRTDGGYDVRFSDSSATVVADFVILTNPWTTLRKVDLEGAGFDPYRMEAIQSLGMGTDVKLLLQYTKRPREFKVGDRVWSGGMEHTDPNFETWESSTDEHGSSGLITVYAGGSGSQVFANEEQHVAGPPALVDTILGHIDDVVPGSKQHYNGTAWLDYWTGDPWTLGSYACYPPGQMTKYWGYAGIPAGRVHFAGEHTSTYSQGFLNGGVESGQRAAIEVMNAIGVPVPDSIGSLPYTKAPVSPA